MDQNEMFKEFIQILIREKMVTINENGDIDFVPTSSGQRKAKVCTCMKDTEQERQIINKASKSSIITLLWEVLPKLDILGIIGCIMPLIKPIALRRIDLLEMTQLLIKIIPELKSKLQIQGNESKM